jgi:hypothetical protein
MQKLHNARGVRQGNPLTLVLFDFMVDALDAMLTRANEARHASRRWFPTS